MTPTAYTLERRGRKRRRMDTPVRILQTAQTGPPPEVMVGAMRDVSELGMFISVEHPCRVDAELLCDVCLPEPHQSLPVRGRVVWVQSAPEPGMGIEFIDVAEPDRSLLQQVAGVSPGQEVKVWLETLTHPIRARVVRTADGLLVTSKLPFLRLLSKVVIYPAQPDAGESYSGIIDAVSLRPGLDSTAEIQLHVSLVEDEALSAQQEAAPAVETAQQEAAAPAVETAPPMIQLPRVMPATEACGEIETRAAPPPQLTPEPLVQTSATLHDQLIRFEQEQTLSLPELDPCADSHWKLHSDPDDESLPPRRQGRVWVWLAALAMLGFTAASLVHTNAWSRAVRWARYQFGLAHAESSIEGLRPTIVPARAPVPPTPVHAVVATHPTVSPRPPSPARPHLARSVPHPSGAPPLRARAPRVVKGPLLPAAAPTVSDDTSARDTPHVELQRGQRVLVIPLKGNTRDATHYRLASPDGLVVNLPHARPRVAFGDYPLPEAPFRLIWLRRRDEGLHLRVLFQDKLPGYRLKIQGSAVRVMLEADGAE